MERKNFLDGIHDAVIQLRVNPQRRKEKVFVGCGAGFGGDRPLPALKLLAKVKELNYLVLECLAERTLAERHQSMMSGGSGYDPRISEWMSQLLPLAIERGTCIITNMGAMDPLGAQHKVLEIASSLGLSVSVAVAREASHQESRSSPKQSMLSELGGISTYLGAAPIVECLQRYQPNVIITSRVADASLFLAPMVYELGWNWNELELLAQGSLAGHLLECGCQLTGGYFMHPGDKYRDSAFSDLLNLSLPYAEICSDGKVCVMKAEGSGGVINFSSCAQQLLYEVGDPSAYITPDLVIDFQGVSFKPLSSSKVLCLGAKPSAEPVPDKLLQMVPKDCGWKGWGEISYGGHQSVKRAKAAEFLVKSWMEEIFPGVSCHILSYIIGLDSLKVMYVDKLPSAATETCVDIRLRMDGLFREKEHAVQFTKEFLALYTNGPAGGGGISTGHKKDIVLEKHLVEREQIFWQTGVKHTEIQVEMKVENNMPEADVKDIILHEPSLQRINLDLDTCYLDSCSSPEITPSPAPHSLKIPLYNVAHSRSGDKGNDLNFSLIPHFPPDFERLKLVITPQWVKGVFSTLLNPDTNATAEKDDGQHIKVEIYEAKGIHSLNIVVRNILDGGVNCSRRIDRHGKTLSDLILLQVVVLPP